MASFRSSSDVACIASWKASRGAFASITTCRPAGRRTTMSGRSRLSPACVVTCSAKSHCSDIPASSTTRRSVSSPQRPFTLGVRRFAKMSRACSSSFCCCCNAVWVSCSLASAAALASRSRCTSPLVVSIRCSLSLTCCRSSVLRLSSDLDLASNSSNLAEYLFRSVLLAQSQATTPTNAAMIMSVHQASTVTLRTFFLGL